MTHAASVGRGHRKIAGRKRDGWRPGYRAACGIEQQSLGQRWHHRPAVRGAAGVVWGEGDGGVSRKGELGSAGAKRSVADSWRRGGRRSSATATATGRDGQIQRGEQRQAQVAGTVHILSRRHWNSLSWAW